MQHFKTPSCIYESSEEELLSIAGIGPILAQSIREARSLDGAFSILEELDMEKERMVEAYWNVGKLIVEAQDGNERAEYGEHLLKDLSEQLTKEFGKGFTVTNLKYMRQFYLAFSIGHTLCDQLSWSHYRLLSRIDDENIRQFYLDECVECNWSVR